jgi:hypothetical protein
MGKRKRRTNGGADMALNFGGILPLWLLISAIMLAITVGCGRDRSMPRSPHLADDVEKLISGLVLESTKYDLGSRSQNLSGRTSQLEEVSLKFDRIVALLSKVTDVKDRMRLCRVVEGKVLNRYSELTTPSEEIAYHQAACLMLDSLAVAMWETSKSDEMVLSLWVRQAKIFDMQDDKNRKAFHAVYSESRNISMEILNFNRRLSTEGFSSVSESEKSHINEIQARQLVLKVKLRQLEDLIRMYECWDVDARGRALDGGRLYRVFRETRKKGEPKCRIPELPLESFAMQHGSLLADVFKLCHIDV